MDNNCIEIVRALPRQLAEHVQRERGRKEDGEQAASMYRMHALSHQVAEHLHEDRGKTQEGGNAALILNACAVTPAGGAHAGRRTGKGARREIYLETACRRCHAVWRSTCGGTRKERDRRQNNIWRENRAKNVQGREGEGARLPPGARSTRKASTRKARLQASSLERAVPRRCTPEGALGYTNKSHE
ncbi:unnamed protein product, partial [Prorocentrum cordatum]